MSIETLLYFFLSSMFVSFLPGPSMGLVIQASIEEGKKQGLLITLGILLADSILLIGVCLGLVEILTSSKTVMFWMNIFTSSFLLYLGLKVLFAVKNVESTTLKNTKNISYKDGFVLTLISPKTIIFLLAYFPQFIDNNSKLSQTMQLIILSIIFLISVTIVMVGYAILASSARQFFYSKRNKIMMNLTFSLLLMGLAIQNFYTTFYTQTNF